jgi:glycosyltransferase involved in cell wall biosynthesis
VTADRGGAADGGAAVRVLHLVAGLSGGGSERWLRDVVAMSPPGLDHRVVTVEPDAGRNAVYAEELVALAAYEPPRVPVLLAPALPHLRRQWPPRSNALRAVVRGAGAGAALVRVAGMARRFRPDVIHSHTVPDFPIGVAVSRAMRVPLVHTVPCLFSQLADSGRRWTPRMYATFQSSVACFSTGEGRGELEGLHVPPEKILYDLGGVDIGAADAALAERSRHAAEVRTELGLPEGCPVALSVGRLHPSKGHMLALQGLPTSLELVADVHWIVLGEGPQRPALEAMADRLGVRARTHFVGYQRDPLRFFAAADVYLRSAVLEPENLSFYESMAMALPAVGFATGESRDLLVTVGHGEQVPHGDVHAFALATARLLQRPDRGRSLGARGAAYARQHLDLSGSVDRLCAVYLQLSRDGAFLAP